MSSIGVWLVFPPQMWQEEVRAIAMSVQFFSRRVSSLRLFDGMGHGL